MRAVGVKEEHHTQTHTGGLRGELAVEGSTTRSKTGARKRGKARTQGGLAAENGQGTCDQRTAMSAVQCTIGTENERAD